MQAPRYPVKTTSWRRSTRTTVSSMARIPRLRMTTRSPLEVYQSKTCRISILVSRLRPTRKWSARYRNRTLSRMLACACQRSTEVQPKIPRKRRRRQRRGQKFTIIEHQKDDDEKVVAAPAMAGPCIYKCIFAQVNLLSLLSLHSNAAPRKTKCLTLQLHFTGT